MSQQPPQDPATGERPRLEQVQRWMQSILMHRGGVAEGVDSSEARQHIDITLKRLPEVISPSRALSSADRLEIYVNAYYARLLECLDEEFVVTRWAMGEELYGAVAFGYLQSYPSKSYTLNQLGARFPRYLAESRLHAADVPAGATSSWADFVIELATLERSLYEVYDGPGTERDGVLDVGQLSQVSAEAWGDLWLLPAPCLRLHSFDHPVSHFWGEQKDGLEPVVPTAQKSWLAVNRRDYVVERVDLTLVQFVLLEALLNGQSLARALETAAAQAEDAEVESQVGRWFAEWMAAGFFVGYELP